MPEELWHPGQTVDSKFASVPLNAIGGHVDVIFRQVAKCCKRDFGTG